MGKMKQVLLDILDSQEEGDELPTFSFPPYTYKPSRKELMEEDNAEVSAD